MELHLHVFSLFFFTSVIGVAIFIFRALRWPPSFSRLFFHHFFLLFMRSSARQIHLSTVQTLYEFMFCLRLSVTLVLPQFLLLSSSSSSSSSSLSLFVSSYAFVSGNFGRNLNSKDAEKRYFYIKSIRFQVKGPIENFQTRSLTVFCLV